jgi:uncharacterized membrane-anchored protein YjiN (DUF445 family)
MIMTLIRGAMMNNYEVATDHIDMLADQLIHRVHLLQSKSKNKNYIVLSVQRLLEEQHQIMAPMFLAYPLTLETSPCEDVDFGRSDCEFTFKD